MGFGAMDAGGAYVIDPQYSMAERFSGGLARAEMGEEYAYRPHGRDCVGPEVSPWAVSGQGNLTGNPTEDA